MIAWLSSVNKCIIMKKYCVVGALEFTAVLGSRFLFPPQTIEVSGMGILLTTFVSGASSVEC